MEEHPHHRGRDQSKDERLREELEKFFSPLCTEIIRGNRLHRRYDPEEQDEDKHIDFHNHAEHHDAVCARRCGEHTVQDQHDAGFLRFHEKRGETAHENRPRNLHFGLTEKAEANRTHLLRKGECNIDKRRDL